MFGKNVATFDERRLKRLDATSNRRKYYLSLTCLAQNITFPREFKIFKYSFSRNRFRQIPFLRDGLKKNGENKGEYPNVWNRESQGLLEG